MLRFDRIGSHDMFTRTNRFPLAHEVESIIYPTFNLPPAEQVTGGDFCMLLSEAVTLVFQERGGLREKLLTARGYERDARQLCLFIHNPIIENVRIDDVERYFHEMESVGFSRNGIQMKA